MEFEHKSIYIFLIVLFKYLVLRDPGRKIIFIVFLTNYLNKSFLNSDFNEYIFLLRWKLFHIEMVEYLILCVYQKYFNGVSYIKFFFFNCKKDMYKTLQEIKIWLITNHTIFTTLNQSLITISCNNVFVRRL